MLTDAFYRAAAAALAGGAPLDGLAVAVGAGRAAWDVAPPPDDRGTTALVQEVARRRVPPEAVVFLDEQEEPSGEPTPVVRITAVFERNEVAGALRECGLVGRWGGEETLLAYYVHPRLDVTTETALERTIRVDLTPRPVAPGSRVTRWMGNTHPRELHDRERSTPNCQLDEIPTDRRFYFASEAEALAAGYDPCAYCFGRARSRR